MRMFNIPNLFTASNLMCGVLAIFLSFSGRIDIVPYFIFLGAVLDFFDGFLARLLKQQGELGKQLDSLADMVTFGLAPGVFMFVILAAESHPTAAWFAAYDSSDYATMVKEFYGYWSDEVMRWRNFSWVPFIALLIPFFSMFRLAKFNIDTRQSESFIGLNTPSNTIFFTAFPLLLTVYYGEPSWANKLIHTLLEPQFIIPLISAMSLLLISEIPFFSLKFKSFNWKNNEIRYIFLISCGILIPTLLVWSIPIIILLYLLLSLINNVRKRRHQNRTHEIQS